MSPLPAANIAPQRLGPQMRRRLAGFARTLRDNAFRIGLAETRDALLILASPMAVRPESLKAALRALFCATHSDWQRFDAIFDAFWRRRSRRVPRTGSSENRQSPPQQHDAGLPPAGLPEEVRRPVTAEGASRRGRPEGASRTEALTVMDLRHIVDPQDLSEAHALAERLARRMRARLIRRRQSKRAGRQLDLRGTIHRSVSHGGTPVDLVWRRRKQKPLRLVILLDASGSMSLYTAFFVRFLHGVVDSFREAEAFIFHTRLAHVSLSLRERDPARAVERLALMAEGIGGGTRIGESLATFNRWHAARVVHSRTAVMIVSDGYDTGPRHAGGAAVCRPVRAGPQPCEPCRARTRACENLMQPDILDQLCAIKNKGEPFALATVVRTVAATAAKAGAKAVILPDGTISEGWIGGGCARAAVLKAAQQALADGKPRLVSVQPPDCLEAQGVAAGDEHAGVQFATNSCPSRGTMDVFVEPMLPRPHVVVCGASPVAVAVADLGRRLGFAVTVCAPAADQTRFPQADRRIEGYALPVTEGFARYVVVSTQGRGDRAALRAALAIEAAYVGFVGSRHKAQAERAALLKSGVCGERLARLRCPAGLDLGAITPEEIALSILAEIVALRRRDPRSVTAR
jgi:uncharacterized protein